MSAIDYCLLSNVSVWNFVDCKELLQRCHVDDLLVEMRSCDNDQGKLFDYFRLGVSALSLFFRENFLGPPVAEVKLDERLDAVAKADGLAIDSESIYALTRSPGLLYVAKKILLDFDWHSIFPLSAWWRFRVGWIWQRMFLDRKVQLKELILDEISFLDDRLNSLDLPDELKSSYYIEKSYAYCYYYEYDNAQKALTNAFGVAKLNQVRLSGVLGRRTRFQTKDLAQLVVEAIPHESDQDDISKAIPRAEFPVDCALNDETLLEKAALQTEVSHRMPTEIQECAVLALLDNLEKAQSLEALAEEIRRAYIDKILEFPVTYVGKFVCLLKRCRLEKGDWRRVERALGQMEALSKQFDGQPDIDVRCRLAYSVNFPTTWEVRQFEAQMLSRFGCNSEALQIYLDLQLWEDAVEAYRNMGMPERAEHIIREQLRIQETPRFLCLLGDILNDDECYRKAWELSGKRYARAQASLGMLHFIRKRYNEAVASFELALAIQPLQLTTWYNLGYAAMQINEYEKAARAYHRCTTIDPDNFEAWNNLAACYVHLGKKQRAFQILTEALRCNYENWKVWDNYIVLAVDTGNFKEAVDGIGRMMDLKQVYEDIEVLEILVRAATEMDDGKNIGNDLAKLFGRLTSVTTGNTQIWRLYSRLRRPHNDADVDEWEKYVSLLQRAHQTGLRAPAWEKNDHETEQICDYALCLSNAQIHLAGILPPEHERVKQLKASARILLKGVIATASLVERAADSKVPSLLESMKVELNALVP